MNRGVESDSIVSRQKREAPGKVQDILKRKKRSRNHCPIISSIWTIMKRINKDSPPKPCDYFDLIGGTSTGGLIALMLGRFHMDIDECIDKYQQIAASAFQERRSRADIIGRGKDVLKAKGRYQSDALIHEFKSAARMIEGDEDAALSSTDMTCRV
ncbi:hypothetical protein GGR57DRAFT_105052 [Xylariaceae sp. FL1272]|nr:hypothetical protein GGR57DRAFT_105052 [Xylariaceae sp. FL1272]